MNINSFRPEKYARRNYWFGSSTANFPITIVVRRYMVVCLCSVITPWSVFAQSDDANTLAVSAAAGFRSNLSAFNYFTCHYTVTVGFAASTEDAALGKFVPGARTAVASVVKDGNSVCFRIQEDAETTKDRKKPPKENKSMGISGAKFGSAVSFMTTDCIANGMYSFRIDPLHNSGSIFHVGAEYDTNPDSILEAIRVNSKLDFARLANLSSSGLVISGANVNSGNTPRIHVEYSIPSTIIVDVTVDPTKGYLPLVSELTVPNDTAKNTTTITKVIACSKGRWFPEQVVTFLRQFPPPHPGFVRVYNVTKFDADNRPLAEALSISIPAGATINQVPKANKYFKTKQLEKITPDDLDRIHALTETSTPPNTQPTLVDTAIHPPRRTWYWYVSGGVIASLAAGYAVRRMLASRRKSDAT